MICSDQLDRQSAQAHRLGFLVAEVLVKEGTPHGSATLDEEKEMVLFSGVLAAIWCFWGLFSWLGWAGGHRHLFGNF